MISCKEAVSRLWTYLDRNLGAPQERELEEHLGLCRHCCGELEFARQLRERLQVAAPEMEVSAETRSRVESFLRRLGEKGSR